MRGGGKTRLGSRARCKRATTRRRLRISRHSLCVHQLLVLMLSRSRNNNPRPAVGPLAAHACAWHRHAIPGRACVRCAGDTAVHEALLFGAITWSSAQRADIIGPFGPTRSQNGVMRCSGGKGALIHRTYRHLILPYRVQRKARSALRWPPPCGLPERNLFPP